MIDEQNVKEKLYTLIIPRLKKLGIKSKDINESSSMLTQGVFDSMSFIEFIADVEDYFNIEIDFEELDASDFTSVNQLEELIIKTKMNE